MKFWRIAIICGIIVGFGDWLLSVTLPNFPIRDSWIPLLFGYLCVVVEMIVQRRPFQALLNTASGCFAMLLIANYTVWHLGRLYYAVVGVLFGLVTICFLVGLLFSNSKFRDVIKTDPTHG